MAEKPKPDLNADLHRTLNNACRKWGAREIRLRYLPKPSINRWIAEALIDHHRVIEKIRTDIPAGELTLQNMESFNDSRLPAAWVTRQPTRSKPCRPCNGERREMGEGRLVPTEG
jgi:hypothetical protein